MHYKPRAYIEISTPVSGSGDSQNRTWSPPVIELKWTKNHHLACDELSVVIGWREAGIDPRLLKHARIWMWFWDDAYEVMDKQKHLRFVGICKKAERKVAQDGWRVDMLFHDYTTFFLMMKPFPTTGMPEFTDNFREIWRKVCDNTGYRELNSPEGKIKSNVTGLREQLVFIPEALENRTLGESVSGRFHKIAKPTPKNRTDAWGVWQWCCASIGLVSYIDREVCVVTTTNERYKETNAPKMIYGENILTFNESVDTHVAMKGILGKSYDPLKGVLLESSYPSPNDPRIKKKRSALGKKSEDGVLASLNETSAEYEEFNFHECSTQEALDSRVREAWEEFSRQEMHGKISTREMFVEGVDGELIDVLGLNAGDCIHIGMDDEAREIVSSEHFSDAEKVTLLMDTCDYIREVAELVVANMRKFAVLSPIFHVETLELTYSHGEFNIDIAYHNKVNISGVYD